MAVRCSSAKSAVCVNANAEKSGGSSEPDCRNWAMLNRYLQVLTTSVGATKVRAFDESVPCTLGMPLTEVQGANYLQTALGNNFCHQ